MKEGQKEQHVSVALRKYNYLEGSINEQYHIMAASLGLSDSAFDMLYVLFQEGDGCSQTMLYKNSGISRKTAGSSLQKLQAEGVLVIRRGEKRGNRIFLTDKGRKLLEEKIAPVIRAENAVFQSWTAEERKTFFTLNQRYLDEITSGFAEIRNSRAENETD